MTAAIVRKRTLVKRNSPKRRSGAHKKRAVDLFSVCKTPPPPLTYFSSHMCTQYWIKSTICNDLSRIVLHSITIIAKTLRISPGIASKCASSMCIHICAQFLSLPRIMRVLVCQSVSILRFVSLCGELWRPATTRQQNRKEEKKMHKIAYQHRIDIPVDCWSI